MKKVIVLAFICVFISCTQITYIHSKDELNIFKIQNKVTKVDTLHQDEVVYKVYYRDFP